MNPSERNPFPVQITISPTRYQTNHAKSSIEIKNGYMSRHFKNDSHSDIIQNEQREKPGVGAYTLRKVQSQLSQSNFTFRLVRPQSRKTYVDQAVESQTCSHDFYEIGPAFKRTRASGIGVKMAPRFQQYRQQLDGKIHYRDYLKEARGERLPLKSNPLENTTDCLSIPQ
ncbi:hypothetical protein SS50377_20395 [Spironucleus salmonicida]|uniref:Uncharacterized protein n=1 Tax=Spironucleus salmonicida TaxID=348837 RepID=A0A9P8LZZ3_9EUKA|nr:hypothetical protein SS50377_20395 [Spironucleus salmonicida]